MNRFTIGTLVVVTMTVMGKAQATVIADAVGDYVPGTNNGDPGIVPAIGTGEWQYLASDTVNPTLDASLDVLPWEPTNGWYINFTSGGSANSVGVPNPNLAPDELGVGASGFSRSPEFTLLRWITGTGEAGAIGISGNLRHIERPAVGDDTTFDIFVDGVSIFSQFLPGGDTVGFAFNETATISVGSTVDFVIGPNVTDSWDFPALKATIVPEPSTLTLAALGLIGLLAYSRRRRRA